MKTFFLTLFLLIFFNEVNATNVGKVTGFPIPRFVSLKSDLSNLRIGSSKDFPIKLQYTTSHLPVEIIQEYEDWRKINDFDKNAGWIHKSLLSGSRYGIINQQYSEPVKILNKPQGKVVGEIGKKNIVKLKRCLIDWCYIEIDNNKGWILKINLWGVYEKETLNIPYYQPIINLLWKFI